MSENTLNIIHVKKDNEDVFVLQGHMTILTCEKLQYQIDEVISEGSRSIIFNLLEIAEHGIDSFGIAVIVKTKCDLDKKKGQMKVIVNDDILQLLQKCHLDEYITVELNKEDDL